MRLSKIAWRNIFRNKRRTFLSMIAIAVASMGIVLLFGIIDWMKEDMRNNLFNFYTGQIRIRNKKYDAYENMSPLHLKIDNANDLIRDLSRIHGIEAISPRINFNAVYVDSESEMKGVYCKALDFEREKAYSEIQRYLQKGRLPLSDRKEVAITPYLLKKFRLKIGDTVTLLSHTASYGSNAMSFKVVGIVQFPINGMNKALYLPLDIAQRFLRMRSKGSNRFDAVTEILIKIKPKFKESVVLNNIKSVIDRGTNKPLKAVLWRDIKSGYSIIRMADIVYNIISFFFFVLGSSVIMNTTIMVIYERMREIGTMSALGMEGSELIRIFFLESLYISIIGSFFGVAIGWGISYLLSIHGIDMSGAVSGISIEFSNIYYLKPSVKSLLIIFCYSVGIASLASFFPSRKAVKLDPVEALRSV